ncbi:MAG: hypothetical protein QF570_22365 [Myxococcota bacterium]|nr:hypothetical protein [Myxococcota bacterium]
MHDARALSIPTYDRGTGVEEFAFMPCYVRKTVKDLRPQTSFP